MRRCEFSEWYIGLESFRLRMFNCNLLTVLEVVNMPVTGVSPSVDIDWLTHVFVEFLITHSLSSYIYIYQLHVQLVPCGNPHFLAFGDVAYPAFSRKYILFLERSKVFRWNLRRLSDQLSLFVTEQEFVHFRVFLITRVGWWCTPWVKNSHADVLF